ncbi:MAG: CvpA family protein [Acidimicrobiia bacterium]|nr:CvpA family protein [Acidimicrobiia bacterium]
MIDFLLGLYLAGLAVRGWLRGFVKELLDLVGLVIGLFVAFRLSSPMGDFISDRFDVTPEWARIGAGIALFLIVGATLGTLAHYLGKVMRLPGLNLANRLAGSGFALAWGIALILVVTSVLRALPMPSAVDEQLDESEVVTVLASPDSPTQQAFQRLVGDEVLDTLLALGPLIGDRNVVLEGDERIEIPPADPDELSVDTTAADEVFVLLNGARAEDGAQPLAWSDALAEVALAHAMDMYVNGYVSHVSPTTGNVGDRVRAARIPLSVVGENLALAATPRAVHAGFMESDGHRANLLRRSFDRVGVGAVDGPLGLMVVQVFGG